MQPLAESSHKPLAPSGNAPGPRLATLGSGVPSKQQEGRYGNQERRSRTHESSADSWTGSRLRNRRTRDSEPGRGQVRIKVQACGVCHSDVLTKEGQWPGIQYPRVPGHEVSAMRFEFGGHREKPAARRAG
ncbi:MAG: alcohol dehydrogenase catalytic domain-containing protein [Rhodospirillales bacterium]